MSLILLGHPHTERTEYFLKAASELLTDWEFVEPVKLIPLPSFTSKAGEAADSDEDFDFSPLQNCVVKVDPPPPESYPIDCLNTVMERYHRFLLKLQSVKGIRLWNSGSAIWDTLDKFICKERLQKKGLPVTPALTDSCGCPVRIGSHDQLKVIMREKGIGQVFIKPRLGSGGAGVVAYRHNHKTGKETMETCAELSGREPRFLRTSAVSSGKRLNNTRKLRKTCDAERIRPLINKVLAQEAIVEEWIPKASYNGKAFDLRAVYQSGRLEFIVARQSNGAITNLHLNDSALAVSDLALSRSMLSEIESLCCKAAALFPGLNTAGFDLLLQKNTMIIMIIEINGQGDLIYKDIFADNRIFKAQIRAMKYLQEKE